MQELEVFTEKLDDLLPKLRESRRSALEEAGEQMLEAVRGRIGGSGKVQRWQHVYMGSKGGYTAVRAQADVDDENGYAVGYATNALESGHQQEPGRYVPAIQRKLIRDRVPGRYMYARTAADVGQLTQAAAEQIERDMALFMEV